jgi:hypothetical protein
MNPFVGEGSNGAASENSEKRCSPIKARSVRGL